MNEGIQASTAHDSTLMCFNCKKCDKHVQTKATLRQWVDWERGMFIQLAMPNLDANERESVQRSYCIPCVKDLYGE